MSQPLPPTVPDDPSSAEPGGGTSTSVLEREETTEQVEPGDHERFAHYVRKEKILGSAMSGKPVIALCGKVWVPGRDPKKFPVCPTCKEIYCLLYTSPEPTRQAEISYAVFCLKKKK